ncbi:MAG: sugar ABC transporter permease [Bacillota bacterium]
MKREAGWWLVLPACAVVGLTLLAPVLYTAALSFANYSLAGRGSTSWAGVSHYLGLLGDEEFRVSLVNTLVFAFVTVPAELVMGLALAVLIHRSFRGRGLVRLAVLFPWALPTALNAIMWRWMYNTDYGLFNAVLLQAGLIEQPVNWLGTIPTAMISMMIVAVWKTSSFMALLLLAGLQAIPEELYESGQIDGATGWAAFRRITLPLLRPSILVAVLLRGMDAFRAFELPMNLTGGGPINTTETLSLYAYKVLFQFVDFDYGSSVVMVQFLVLFGLSVLYIRALRAET